jgi:hypothetical protein
MDNNPLRDYRGPFDQEPAAVEPQTAAPAAHNGTPRPQPAAADPLAEIHAHMAQPKQDYTAGQSRESVADVLKGFGIDGGPEPTGPEEPFTMPDAEEEETNAPPRPPHGADPLDVRTKNVDGAIAIGLQLLNGTEDDGPYRGTKEEREELKAALVNWRPSMGTELSPGLDLLWTIIRQKWVHLYTGIRYRYAQLRYWYANRRAKAQQAAQGARPQQAAHVEDAVIIDERGKGTPPPPAPPKPKAKPATTVCRLPGCELPVKPGRQYCTPSHRSIHQNGIRTGKFESDA